MLILLTVIQIAPVKFGPMDGNSKGHRTSAER